MANKFVILAAIDLNPGSAIVLDRALSMGASQPDSELHVLSVSEPRVPLAAYPGMVAPPGAEGIDPQEVVGFCKKRIEAFQAEHAGAKIPQVLVHTSVGVPADEIVWLAASLNADAILIGTHGRRGLKRILLGSVAEKVVRLAGCPVLTVREKNHNPEWKVPEIEPLCEECAKTRARTNGADLWCERHHEHHVRTHVYGYSATTDAPPRSWGSSTGT
jgi:nucleotide-binding universal stress UspA family protein